MNNIATNYLPPSLTENYCDFKYRGTSRVHRTIQCEGNNILPTIHVKYCIQFDTARGSLRRRIRYLFPRQTRLHPRECWVTIQRVLRDCRRGMINLVQLRVDGTQTSNGDVVCCSLDIAAPTFLSIPTTMVCVPSTLNCTKLIIPRRQSRSTL